jgi:RNA polymerase sigma-70 factor (ECF subfamily)
VRAKDEHIQLLAEARLGDRAGMGKLAALVWKRLYPFVFRVTFNHDVTEDILQETLLSLLCGVNGLREPDRFWPWMYRIAWSKIQNHRRSRRMQYSAETSFLTLQSGGDMTRGENDSPLDAQVQEETRRQVAEAVDQLAGRHREVLYLRYYDQMPYAEIAARAKATPSRIRVRSHRAMKALKSRLACCL